MARVTIEDCIDKDIEDKYELVILAAQRVSEINSGAKINVDSSDKPTVIALREIGSSSLNIDLLRQKVRNKFSNDNVSHEEEYNDLEELDDKSYADDTPYIEDFIEDTEVIEDSEHEEYPYEEE